MPEPVSFFGLNIQDTYPPDELLVRLQPGVLVTFDAGYASHLCDLLPETEVYYRSWTSHPDAGDDGIANRLGDPSRSGWYVTPETRALQMDRACSDPRVWLVAENEARDDANQVAWEVRCTQKLLSLGRKCTIGNYGPGGPTKTIEALDGNLVDWGGLLRPIAELASKHPNQVRLMLHEYVYHHDWRWGAELGREPPVYWYAGRHQQLRRMFPEARIVLGEVGSDDLDGKYKGPWASPMDPDKDVLSPQGYVELLLATYAPCWREMFQAGQVRGGAIFTWSKQEKWRVFDMSGMDRTLLIALFDGARREGTVDTELMTVTVRQELNRRIAPGVTARQLSSQFLPGTYTLLVGPDITQGSHHWRLFDDQAGNTWYSATGPIDSTIEWITLKPVVAPEPEPEDPPVEEPEEPGPTVEERWAVVMAAWVETLKAIEATCAELRGVIEETFPAVKSV